MRHHPNRFGLALLAAFGLILGAVVLGKLFKLALLAGGVFLVWKIFFASGEKGRTAERPRSADVLPPLPVAELEPDPERARLDRELDQAIAAANARRSAASPMG